MGRKKILEKHPDWGKEIPVMYTEEGKSVKYISEFYNLSTKTTRKILKGEGVTLKRGAPKGTTRAPYHSSCLAEWIRTHPGVRLPRKVAKITELTGCPPNSVKTYLWRRRKEVRDVVKGIDFLSLRFVLTDLGGKRFPTMAMRTCSAKVDPFSFNVHLKGEAKPSGSFTLEISFSELQLIQKSLDSLGPT